MTTIAYRDGVLASDTQTSIHDGATITPDKSKKIIALKDGSFIAGSGIKRQISDFAKWCELGSGDKPGTGESTIIRVFPDGGVVVYDGETDERDVTGCPFYAVGSGAAAALGAMYAGARADQAVEIAMRVDPWTGGTVDVVRLHDNVIKIA